MIDEVIATANHIAVLRIIQFYLDPNQEEHIWIIEGAHVRCHRSWNRYGLPSNATCVRYVFEHPEQGWSFGVRCTWRDGRLHEPVAVHTQIEDYFADDTNLIADEAAAAVAVNDWIQGVRL